MYLLGSFPFIFNFYSSLLIPFVIQGLVCGILFIVKGLRRSEKGCILFALLLFINTLQISYWMLGFAGWYDLHNGFTTFMFYFPFHNLILSGPLLYFYFQFSTNSGFKLEKKHWPHFVIPVLWLLLILSKFLGDFILHRPFDLTAEGQYGTRGPWAEWDKSHLAGLAGYLIFFFYSYKTIHSYMAYRIYIRNNFSNLDYIDFSWLIRVVIAVSMGALIMLIFELFSFSRHSVTYRNEWYSYFCLGVITYYSAIGQLSFASRNRFLNFVLPQPIEPAIQQVAPKLSVELQKNNPTQILADKLTGHLEEAKPFLDPELTLTDLAKNLESNSSTLSKTINECFSLNFNELINKYRVQEVQSRLLHQHHKIHTLISIAFDAGFNSKSTFNRAFKKVTGLTPKEYIHQMDLSSPEVLTDRQV